MVTCISWLSETGACIEAMAAHDESSHDPWFPSDSPTLPLSFGAQTLKGPSRSPVFDGSQALAQAPGRLQACWGSQSGLVFWDGVFETQVLTHQSWLWYHDILLGWRIHFVTLELLPPDNNVLLPGVSSAVGIRALTTKVNQGSSSGDVWYRYLKGRGSI